MRNGRIAPPGYVLPNRPRWQGGWNLRSLFGAVLAFTLAAGAATQWLAIQLHNPIEMGEPIFRVHGTSIYPAVRCPGALEAFRGQPPYQLWSPQGPLDCLRRNHRRRPLPRLFDLLVSLAHPRPQEHRQPDEPAWLGDLGNARRH